MGTGFSTIHKEIGQPGAARFGMIGWMKRYLRWAGNGIFILLVMTVAFVAVSTWFFDWRFDAVGTGSMEPTYKIGGMVVIRPVEAEKIAVGDVITFRSPMESRQLITHRVIEVVREDGGLVFRTQGDGNPEPDGFDIPAENLRGEVCCYVPLIGHGVDFVKSPEGGIVFVGVPAGFLLWMERKRIRAWLT
ncbi:MAG: signal peptidase I [Dehalococcoidia bacterium]|nr:signal peptidase I [Dehalococcoidia bacterium]